MTSHVRYPSLYQINTRIWLRRLSRQQGKTVTLKDVPDEELDRIAGLGFDWVWLLSVWQTGEASRAVSRSNPGWREAFGETLPDLTEDDICGSGFAITSYSASGGLGVGDDRDAVAPRINKSRNGPGSGLMPASVSASRTALIDHKSKMAAVVGGLPTAPSAARGIGHRDR